MVAKGALDGPAPSPAHPATPATPPAAGPQIQRRDAWQDVPAYPGFKVRVWTNYPQRVLDELESRDLDRMRAALGQLVLEHNGWRDFDGQPYPPASDDAFWTGERALPTELAATVIRLVRNAVYDLPNSLARR